MRTSILLLHNQAGERGGGETERETERDRVHTGKKRGGREGLIIAKQCRKTK